MAYAPIPLDIPPGVIKSDTPTSVGRRWIDTNMVRFWQGHPERWGGWVKHTSNSLGNPARGSIAWRALDGKRYMAWGTANKLWLLENGVLFDITPAGFVAGLVDGVIRDIPWGGYLSTGWGIGGWGGTVSLGAGNAGNPLTWSLATWGEDLIACPRGDTIYHWDKSVGTGTPAVAISGAPTTCLSIFVTQSDRHLIALGAHDGTSDDTLRIAWPNQETLTDWTPTDVNTAGDKRAERGNEIMGAVEVTGGHIIVTDTSTYYMRYIGGDFIFSIEHIADTNGLIGPMAIASQNGSARWMGPDGFYFYGGGTVEKLNCDIHDYIFNDINRLNAHKVVAGINSRFGETIWFYPSAGSVENDRYVAVNADGWSHGTLARTSWLDRNVATDSPVGTDPEGNIYLHESGTTANGSAISYRLESGEIYADTGSETGTSPHMEARRFVPDADERMTGSHTVTIVAREWPRKQTQTKGPYTYNADTADFPVRARGSSYRIIMEGSGDFRLGKSRLMVTKHGERSS